MALRHLVSRFGVPALRPASSPLFSPAAGSRPLSYGSWQGRGHGRSLSDIVDVIKRSNASYQEHVRMLKMLVERHNEVTRSYREEWDGFEKIVRRDLQDLRRFTKKMEKIADVSLVVGVGAFFLAAGVRYFDVI